MTDSHRNDERTVRCPVEGCDAEKLARGIHLHVRQSSGDGHGPQDDVPDHISFDNLETVGEQEVQMDYPSERESEAVARLCPCCERPFKGTNGVLIHLAQMAGRKDHPVDGAERHAEDDFPIVEVDDQDNIVDVVGESMGVSDEDSGNGGVPVQRVIRLLAAILAEDKPELANRVRQELLGPIDPDRPDTTAGLFEALVSEGRSEVAEPSTRVRHQEDGIHVECRGTSADLSAEEVRWLADGLELAAQEENWSVTPTDLIEYLRDGAKYLEGNLSSRHLTARYLLWDQ